MTLLFQKNSVKYWSTKKKKDSSVSAIYFYDEQVFGVCLDKTAVSSFMWLFFGVHKCFCLMSSYSALVEFDVPLVAVEDSGQLTD